MSSPSFQIERQPFLLAANHQLTPVNSNKPLPLQQHAFYAAAMQAFGANIEEIIVKQDSEPVLKGYFLHRTFMRFVHVTSALRGPLWHDDAAPESLKIETLKFLKKQFSNWRWNFLSIMPELHDDALNKKLLRSAGFHRIMTGASTVWLDLGQTENAFRQKLDGNWRNQLKKAEKENLSISIGGAKAKHYNWLLEREKDQRQNRNYLALPTGFIEAYAEAGKLLNAKDPNIISVTAIENGNKIAGALFLIHGNSATYHIGWAGERARTINAQNQVLYSGAQTLMERGIQWLDLGGLDTGPQAGIARFKLGMGATPIILAGTYI
ncbi:GNAT family N-acetyltransferase [Kordiimonas aquimaris]|uniref:GNAT family N-acetyltransferase n=1 Tax=Kordiimonas aquimaris TaxID=707591 RepID=UPI0021CE1884|nr:GNAT family N-acetyltransferase [Kordiimonas aquimaris]